MLIDELIRQITINCAERGLLLLRVRDEARMTISAYETLYESSIAYGVRKALIAEQRKIDLDQKLKELQSNKRDLQQQVENLKNTIEMTQQRALEKREQEEKLHAEEVSIRLVLWYFSFSYRFFLVVGLCLHLG
jgi:dynein light intermediate chain